MDAHGMPSKPEAGGWWLWVRYGLFAVCLLLFFAFAASILKVRTMGGNGRETETLLRMQEVEQAYKNYFALNDSWPVSPEVLIETAPDGQPPLLEGGQSAITSEWGAPFHVEVQADGDERGRVVVTTTIPSGKVLRWPQK